MSSCPSDQPGRNDPCWCGSGLKYKKCHLSFDERLEELRLAGRQVPPHSLIKNAGDLAGIRASARINAGALDLVARHIAPGVTTGELDRLACTYITDHHAVPACLNYNGFPKGICISVNNEVCHGIPDDGRVLQEGDIVNVDCTTILGGYFADASRMFCIGRVSQQAQQLVDVTLECMRLGIEAIRPWGTVGDIGEAINRCAREHGYSVVTALGGHGVGKAFHEEPFVNHAAKGGTGMVLVPGMVLTVEPMINAGGSDVYVDEDNGWTIYTEDGSLSAQWEHTVAVTETGVEILAR